MLARGLCGILRAGIELKDERSYLMSKNPPPLIPLPLGQRLIILAAFFALIITIAMIRGATPAMKKGYERWAAKNR